jgi:hypothetical protein
VPQLKEAPALTPLRLQPTRTSPKPLPSPPLPQIQSLLEARLAELEQQLGAQLDGAQAQVAAQLQAVAAHVAELGSVRAFLLAAPATPLPGGVEDGRLKAAMLQLFCSRSSARLQGVDLTGARQACEELSRHAALLPAVPDDPAVMAALARQGELAAVARAEAAERALAEAREELQQEQEWWQAAELDQLRMQAKVEAERARRRGPQGRGQSVEGGGAGEVDAVVGVWRLPGQQPSSKLAADGVQHAQGGGVC